MTSAHWRHGVQLAAAVVASYLVSTVLGLPESFWAAMSALIVMRPTTGSTLGAGWDRVWGTLAGTVFGLGGVWLQHIGLGSTATTLGIAALLALASARFPSMRSAPIAALIVLSSGGMAAQPALKVAALRVVEIAIGVATGLAISLIGVASRTRASFDAASASTLRRIAGDVRRELGPAPATPKEKEAAAGALRLALRELAVLAASADREAQLWRRLRRRSRDSAGDCARTARLVARISHDAGLFARLADSTSASRDEASWMALGEGIARAIMTTADRLDRRTMPDVATLRRFGVAGSQAASRNQPAVPSQICWIAPIVQLLAQDLAGLARSFPPSDDVRRPPPPLPPAPTSG